MAAVGCPAAGRASPGSTSADVVPPRSTAAGGAAPGFSAALVTGRLRRRLTAGLSHRPVTTVLRDARLGAGVLRRRHAVDRLLDPVSLGGHGSSARRPWGFRGRYPDPGDAPAVELGDRQRVTVAAGDLTDGRDMAELLEDVAGDGLVRPVGQGKSCLVLEVVEVEEAVDLELPSQERVVSGSSASYSSLMSPISSSTRSSRVMIPAVPPYSSTTIARCEPSRRMSVSADRR